MEFAVNGVLCGGAHSQVQNPRAQCLYKHKISKVSVAGHKDAVLLLGYAEKLFIACL